MKKVISALLIIIMTMSTIVMPAMAKDNITVEIDGREIIFDVQPQIINDRTMVPLRAIFEALGASVEWNQEKQMVTSVRHDKRITLVINESSMLVNGKSVELDTPACIIDERTLVPVRAISEAFDLHVEWDGATKTVLISSELYTTAFGILRDAIIKNGEYDVKNGIYFMFAESENFSHLLSYDPTINEINCVVHGIHSDSMETYGGIFIGKKYLPMTTLEIKEMGRESVIRFIHENGSRTILENTVEPHLQKISLDIHDAAMESCDIFIQKYSYVTLADFGIYY